MRLAAFRSAAHTLVTPILLTVAASVATVQAQEPRRLLRPDSVSIDLVGALVSGSFGGEPQILAGAMPEWIANRLPLPSGAHVLGSAFLGTTVISVINVPNTSDSVLADFRRGLRAHGWTEPPPPPSYSAFRSAPTTQFPSPLSRLTLCGDQQILTASSARQLGESTHIIVRVNASSGTNPCHPVVFQAAQANRPALPTLFNPPGPPADPRMFVDCSPAFNMSMANASATILRSSMSPDAILDHYGRQLQDSGWAPLGAKGSTVGRTWTRRDSTGATQEAVISVTMSGRDSTCRHVNLQLRTGSKP